MTTSTPASWSADERDALGFHQASVAHGDPLALHIGDGTVAWHVLEPFGGRDSRACGLGALNNGGGQRVFRVALDGGDQAQELSLLDRCPGRFRP